MPIKDYFNFMEITEIRGDETSTDRVYIERDGSSFIIVHSNRNPWGGYEHRIELTEAELRNISETLP